MREERAGGPLSPAAGGLVLAYHRVSDARTDPWGLCVTPERFAEQLEVLCRSVRPLSLGELLARARGGSLPPRAVALTFDDGYADNLLAARPLLERFGVPATVFVASGYLGARREFWWDELERVVVHAPRLPVELRLRIAGNEHRWEVPDGTLSPGELPRPGSAWRGLARARLRLYRELWERLFAGPQAARDEALARLREWAGAAPAVRDSHRPLFPGELVSLAESGLIEIGAHTVTHPALDRISPRRQRQEVVESRKRLEEITGRPVRWFSYPHGRRSAATVEIVREAGFAGACALDHEPVRAEALDFLQIPRAVAWNWSGEELERHLAGWLGG